MSRNAPTNDVDFHEIDGHAFEALCFDLVRRLGFSQVVWRDGGGDRGRDIEAEFRPTNPISDGYSERWFFECKNHRTGVGASELLDKLGWADAEKPDHLAFIVSTHLTQDAREFLGKVAPEKRYRIHIVEGRVLQELVKGFPDLVESHFRYSLNEFLGGALRQWNALELLLSAEQLALLSKSLDPNQLAPETNALLLVTSLFRENELSELDDDEISFEPFLEALQCVARPGPPLLAHLPPFHAGDQTSRSHSFRVELIDGKLMVPEDPKPTPDWKPLVAAHIWVEDDRRPYPALYAYVVADDGNSALEILVEGGAALTSAVRLIDSAIGEDQATSTAFLRSRRPKG